ncbi:MAG: ATP-binding cassette domain-containing protein [Gammaproteobacteria bacterium]|jgi:tungstate transport system ATP-binding protein
MSDTPLIEVTNLCLRLNNTDLLNSISVSSKTRGVTMVMGPNGAGKSLFLKCLHGLIQPTFGSIKVCGENVQGPSNDQAMVFQKPVLLRRSVLENLAFAAPQGTELGAINNALATAHLGDKRDLPARLLSGGEQQRLAVVRALLRNPKLLVLDEPTASLDPASVQIIEGLIRDFTELGGKTIFISHDLGQAKRLGSEIIFLHKGRVVEHSDADIFFRNPASKEAKAYLNGQLII